MKIEGVTRQTDGNAVVGRDKHRRQSRRSDPLHRYVLGCQRDLMFLGFLNYRVDQFLVRRMRIRSPGQCHHPQVIGKRIVSQLRGNDLKSDIDHSDDD